MKTHLNLVQTDFHETEKRVLPRFPFSYLTCRSTHKDNDKVFEVHDISKLGMRILLKDGVHTFTEKDSISGSLHWKRKTFRFEGSVEWVKSNSLGVSFDRHKSEISGFLCPQNIVDAFKPIHQGDWELPANLKFWLRADGPVEIFMWQHKDLEISKFLIIMFDHFVEWEDGKGLKSGKVISQRDVDSPLMSEDEFVFEIDGAVAPRELHFAQEIARIVPETYLSKSAIEFLQVKLGVTLSN